MSTSFWSSLTEKIIQLFEDKELQKIQETEETEEPDNLYRACGTGNVEMVNRCIESIENEEYPDNYINNGLVLACETGYITVVDRLLQNKRVNPSFNYNSAVYEACQHNHILIVDLLLQDKRVDPYTVYTFTKKYCYKSIVDRLQQEIQNRENVNQ
jgi:hypothetical protein